VRLREFSTTNSKVVGVLEQKDYEIDGREGDWVHVKDRGWIYFGEYIRWVR